ncbi:hypothetical protein EDC65_1442 [Stella humosa]|uniref:YtkA-like protein n=1 Tax=Stella humosa TaxID=94 RepID=A0A3N1M8V5_9PROT|nr:hypothetical protein [Stella humosa]ROP99658.1 hypothetical protein EDC65_1442 [Stella humosa]
MRLLLAALLLLAPVAAAAECGDELGETGVRRIELPRFTLAYLPDTPLLAPSQMFTLQVAVCGREGGPAPALVRVGAWMPEHGHGMNYAPLLSDEGEGRWRVDGMMFHMPGRWEVTFDLGTARRTERLVAEELVD